jgi:hypothetical protein
MEQAIMPNMPSGRVPHGFAIILHHGPQFAHEDQERDEDHLGHEQQHDDQHDAEPPELSAEELDRCIELVEVELKMLHAMRNGDRVAAGAWAKRWKELGGSLEEDEEPDAGGR